MLTLLWLTTWLSPGATLTSFDVTFNAWQTDDGLPYSQITGVEQSPAGHLWIGTFNGLARFDGSQFKVFTAENTPELKSSRIMSLYRDQSGTLWVGQETGEVSKWAESGFSAGSADPSPRAGSVLCISEDEQKGIWILHENGLAINLDRQIRIAPEPNGVGSPPPCFVKLRNGALWRAQGGRLRSMSRPSEIFLNPGVEYVSRACASTKGGIWIAGGQNVVEAIGEQRTLVAKGVSWGSSAPTAMLESADGLLWLGTIDRGLCVISRTEGVIARFTTANGLTSNWIRHLFQDREGTVWISTGGGGLLSAHKRNVRMPAPPDQWQGKAVLSVGASASGGVWVGTEGAGVYRWKEGEASRYGNAEGLRNSFVWSVLETSGSVYAGTWGAGLFRLEDKRFKPVDLDRDLKLQTTALHISRDGALYLGTQQGLGRLKNGDLSWFGKDLPLPDVRCIVEGENKVIWFGMSGGGLGRLINDKVEVFTRERALPNNYVWCLLIDRGEEETLWMGTFGGGLGRFKNGVFSTISQDHGLPNQIITCIIDDTEGNLWFGSQTGILRAAKADLNNCADGITPMVAFTQFGKADGMASVECSGGMQPAGCRTADGKVWFPTMKGLAMVDPKTIQINSLAPPVQIEEGHIDGTPFFPIKEKSQSPLLATYQKTVVPPGGHRLELRFSALSYIAPEKVKFRYRLHPLEEKWIDGKNRRSVEYTFLPPGDYRFEVIGCNNDGVWNMEGARMDISVQPFFWQTTVFRIMAVALGGLAVAWVVRFNLRQKYRRRLEEVRKEQAIERERSRIAQDIHDDLGASLTRITLLSQPTSDTNVKTSPELGLIYRTARELTRSMDEIVWAVNPRNDTLDSLISYLGGYSQEFLSTAGIRCRIDAPVDLPPSWAVTAETRHNLFLALKEALNNVVKHSGAMEAQVRFILDAGKLILEVKDNGCGYLPDSTLKKTAGGNGILNMQKRLESLGGVFEMDIKNGKGTAIRFTIPALAGKQV